MKRLIVISFLAMLFIQAVPVWQVFAHGKNCYSFVEEDKSDEGQVKIKKDVKEYLSVALPVIELPTKPAQYPDWIQRQLPLHVHDTLTPPPNGAC
jgi:hypothetical protein